MRSSWFIKDELTENSIIRGCGTWWFCILRTDSNERQTHSGLSETALGSCPYGQLLAQCEGPDCSQSRKQLMTERTDMISLMDGWETVKEGHTNRYTVQHVRWCERATDGFNHRTLLVKSIRKFPFRNQSMIQRMLSISIRRAEDIFNDGKPLWVFPQESHPLHIEENRKFKTGVIAWFLYSSR